MNYLIQRAGRFYFNRRVPRVLRKYDPRQTIRLSLKTDSFKTAYRLAVRQNEQLENYWATLVQTGQTHDEQRYKAVADRARLLGFTYLPAQELISLSLDQIAERLLHVHRQDYNKPHVEAVLGGESQPAISLNGALSRFWELSKPQTLNKSANQLRKWRNPRIKAFNNFVGCIGNKEILHLARDDVLRFRDWWIDRIKADNLVNATANKDFIHIKTIISTVVDDLKLNLNTEHLFKKLLLSEDDSDKRLPFETSYITSTLLNPSRLAGLNKQARCALYAIAETGAGIAEQVGLLPEDIVLDTDVPHICIVHRKQKRLKTKYRARKIPLVGYALEAFHECPEGFTAYRDRPDSLSATLGKYLSENGLLPSDKHTIYSLRHSFQDRLLAVNTPDRIQADLMGHKFQRPAYGEGATLKQKMEWIRQIQLK